MTSLSTKMGNSSFRKTIIAIGASFFYFPLVWLIWDGKWDIALCMFFIIVGNNIYTDFK
jgi:hypothetical protein